MQKLFHDGPLVIFTDGGARGNPGPAAIGAVIGGKPYGEYIGETTNNVAEYKALIFALKKAVALLGKEKAGATEVRCNLDSELLVKQLRGEYKIKDSALQPLFVEVWNAKQDFKSVTFTHIPREQNKLADKMVNEALDKALKSGL
ncbi:MAG: ribonuclease HI family protein [Candidatus Harrisonbacteria bacterium]|nr:ribonuclease HI family protein [Candidatus Harrisonbacteria bacterium]